MMWDLSLHEPRNSLCSCNFQIKLIITSRDMCVLFIAEMVSPVQGRCSSEITDLAWAAVVFR